MAETIFTADTTEFQKIAKLFKTAPKELQKPVSRYLGDMAWDFKVNIPKVLDSTYAIREQKLLNPSTTKSFFFIERPKASTPINEQQAAAGTLRFEGSGGLFTGWEEEITGKPREMRKKSGRYHRTIGPNAREDGNMYGKVLGQYKLRPGGLGYNSDKMPDSRDYPELSIKQFIAMLYKSMEPAKVKNEFDYLVFSNGKKRKKHFKEFYKAPKPLLGKNKVFIMSGPQAPLGLYALKDGKVQRMQTFHENSVQSAVGKFDWQSEAVEMTEKKFTPAYVWEKYLAPMIMALFEGK